MKKSRKIAGFLLGTLALAQLAAVPVSAAAAETEGQWEEFAPEERHRWRTRTGLS